MTSTSASGSRESMTDTELVQHEKELSKWESLNIKDLVANAEIVFIEQHFCNDNLKKRPYEVKT